MYFIVRHIVRCDSVRLDQGERARDEDDVGGGINSEEELCYVQKHEVTVNCGTRTWRRRWMVASSDLPTVPVSTCMLATGSRL